MFRQALVCCVALAAIVLIVPASASAQDACWRFRDCGSCAADAQCGWCSATGRCMGGSAQGSPYCPGGWAWTDNQCPAYGHYDGDSCRRFHDCQSCAADAQCGWCGATGHCHSGTAQGSPYCPGAWAWTDNQCGPAVNYGMYGGYRTADRCSQYQSCGPCAADASCGWCAASGRCMSGTQQGSPYCQGGWAWTDNQCGGYNNYPQADRCGRFWDCGTCAADASCGWCAASGHCLSGTAQGSPYCPGGWAWTPNQCTYGAADPAEPAFPTAVALEDDEMPIGCSENTSCALRPPPSAPCQVAGAT